MTAPRVGDSDISANITSVIVRGGSTFLLVRVGGLALGYASNAFLSRLLGLHGYGVYSIAVGWALVLTLPARLGFDNASLKYVTLYLDRREFAALHGFIRTAVWAVTAMSLLLALIIIAVGWWVIREASFAVLFWTGALLIPFALIGVVATMVRVSQRILAAQVYDQVLRNFLLIATLAGWAAWGPKLSAASALRITCVTGLVALAFLYMHFRRLFSEAWKSKPDYGRRGEWISLGWAMLAIGIVQELLNQAEIILLGGFADAREAGLFSAAWRLASLVSLGLVALAIVGGPLVTSAYHGGRTRELHAISCLTARVGIVFATVIALGLICAGPLLLRLFGPGFQSAYLPMLILLVGGFVNAFTGLSAYLLTLTGRERPALVIFAGALAISAGLNLILIPRFGATGAAIASSSATAAWNLAMLFYVRREIGIDASALGLRPSATRLGAALLQEQDSRP